MYKYKSTAFVWRWLNLFGKCSQKNCRENHFQQLKFVDHFQMATESILTVLLLPLDLLIGLNTMNIFDMRVDSFCFVPFFILWLHFHLTSQCIFGVTVLFFLCSVCQGSIFVLRNNAPGCCLFLCEIMMKFIHSETRIFFPLCVSVNIRKATSPMFNKCHGCCRICLHWGGFLSGRYLHGDNSILSLAASPALRNAPLAITLKHSGKIV